MIELDVRWRRLRDRVVVNGRMLRDGVEVEPQGGWPVYILNPPEYVPDGDGFRRDPDEAIRQALRRLAMRA